MDMEIGEKYNFIIKDQCQAFHLGSSTHSMFLQRFVCLVFNYVK